MQRTDLHAAFCPVARSLACVGEWWSLLILRDAFQGLTRFDDFRDSLGISTNILTRRLQHLTRNGIFTRRLYQQRPARYDYVLSAKGRDLLPLLMVLTGWGNKYLAQDGIAVQFADRQTGQLIDPLVIDRGTGAELDIDRLILEPGPVAPAPIIARAQRMRVQPLPPVISAEPSSTNATPRRSRATTSQKRVKS
jgi:DNA-binding HxlR family transcriptional regulator